MVGNYPYFESTAQESFTEFLYPVY
eukprot:SAG11_NODE_659_length_7895_cov_18.189969_1_plen_24_part_10